MTLWVVKAGKYGERLKFALDNNVTLIGFERIGDLNKFDSIESLREFVEEVYPEEKAGAIKNWHINFGISKKTYW